MAAGISEQNGRRDVQLADGEDAARAALEALAPGEAIVLIGDDPHALVAELEEEDAGRFEWSLLDDDEERTRLEVRRRVDRGPRTVTGFLQADHRRLDAIIPVVERLVDTGAFDEARTRFREFACGLDWHIEAEERVLFPYFEAKTGNTRGPTPIMRAEHVEIRDGLERVLAALEEKDRARVGATLGELVPTLAAHNMKEERMLYPMADRATESVEAQERLVARIARS